MPSDLAEFAEKRGSVGPTPTSPSPAASDDRVAPTRQDALALEYWSRSADPGEPDVDHDERSPFARRYDRRRRMIALVIVLSLALPLLIGFVDLFV
jgi:hypothetical protein